MSDLSPATRDPVAWLNDHETFATTLFVWALDQLGPELLTWHPTTIRMEMHEGAKIEMAPESFNKLMAAITIVSTDLFFNDLQKFIHLVNALGVGHFDPTNFIRPDAAECAWAITEALLLSPPDENEAEHYFNDDIRRYLAHILKEEGFLSPPDVLRLALREHPGNSVRHSHGDDAGLTAAIRHHQEGKAEEIRVLLRTNLQELLQQLLRLPLQEGKREPLVERLRQLTEVA